MQKNKGISLIVLVITIVVMIILVGAIVITLRNTSTIGQANDAVEKMDQATLEEIASLGWADAYIEYGTSSQKLTGEALRIKLEEGVNKALDANGLKPEEYGIIVTDQGVRIANGWLQDGDKVIKGKQIINAGDYIQYDETTNVDGVNVDWQVLGANDKGELLILSSTNVVENVELGSTTDLKKAQNDWLNVDSILAEYCKSYAKGKNATGARSIRLEDIHKVTGYRPAEDKRLLDDGNTWEYGKQVFVSYNGTNQPSYEVANGLKGKLSEHTNGFHYYNGTEFVQSDLSKSSGLITKITNTWYINIIDVVNSMLNSKHNYWIATPISECAQGYLNFAIMTFEDKQTNGGVSAEVPCDIWDSNGGKNKFSTGVRAVVSLSSDTIIKDKVDGKWTY